MRRLVAVLPFLAGCATLQAAGVGASGAAHNVLGWAVDLLTGPGTVQAVQAAGAAAFAINPVLGLAILIGGGVMGGLGAWLKLRRPR